MSTPFIGELRMFSFGFPPRGWATCAGQLLAINSNAALFSILGTTYGGNGTNNFALPDLRGRAPIFWGQGPGLANYTLGQQGGAEQVALNTTQIPSHTHQLFGSTAPANRRPVNGGTFADDAVANVDFMAPFNAPSSSYVSLAPQSLALQGSNQGHSNMQASAVTNISIALQGVYPSRN